jgi:hypothetical protein
MNLCFALSTRLAGKGNLGLSCRSRASRNRLLYCGRRQQRSLRPGLVLVRLRREGVVVYAAEGPSLTAIILCHEENRCLKFNQTYNVSSNATACLGSTTSNKGMF